MTPMTPPIMREQLRWAHGYSSLFALAFSPDGMLLATGGRALSTDSTVANHPVKLWDPSTGQEVRHLGTHSAPVTSVAFNPVANVLASGSGSLSSKPTVLNELKLWDLTTDREVLAVTNEISPVRSMAFSPDGTLIATAGLADDQNVALWDASLGVEVRRFIGHTQQVEAVAFDGEGLLIASGGADATLRLWEVATGREVFTHTSFRAVHSVAFSPGSTLVAAGDAYGIIRVWEVATGRERYTFMGPADHTAYSLTFSPDGTLLLSAFGEEYSHIGAALVWKVVDDEQASFAGVTGDVMYATAVTKYNSTLNR